MLLVLTTGQRGQGIHLPKLNNMAQTRDHFHFVFQIPVRNYCDGKQKDLHVVSIATLCVAPYISLYGHVPYYLDSRHEA